MELVSILRLLLRRRALVAISAVMAVAVGVLAVYEVSPSGLTSRTRVEGTGKASALIDTPKSLRVDTESENSETLPTRATLLAALVSSDAGRAAIAESAGLPADRIMVFGPPSAPPTATSPLSGRAFEAAGIVAVPYVVRLATDGAQPIVSIRATAPTGAAAGRLADAAAAALESVAASGEGPDPGPLVVEQLGPARTTEVTVGPRKAYAVVASLVTFVALCSLIVLVAGLAGRWRRRSADSAAPAAA